MGGQTKDRDKRDSQTNRKKDMNAIIIHAIELIRQRKTRRLHFLFFWSLHNAMIPCHLHPLHNHPIATRLFASQPQRRYGERLSAGDETHTS